MGHSTREYDVALVGAGLQNGLIALTLLQHRPDVRVALLEREARPGGNHTWCCHSLDVEGDVRAVVEPLVSARWDGYEVRFPNLRRDFDAAYSMVSSERLASSLREAFDGRSDCLLSCGRAVLSVDAHAVTLDDGSRFEAALVVDGRGRTEGFDHAGYQKFVGLEVESPSPHGLARPVLMDATVAQRGGFCFVYVLPVSEARLLVEHTSFSRDFHFDRGAAEEAIRGYIAAHGWRADRVVRSEAGVLPMPWSFEPPEPTGSPLLAGYRGGWFHPATGYSFPAATRLADHVARTAPDRVFGDEMRRLYRAVRRQSSYAQRLNYMLFHYFEDAQMWNAFERFYGLPADVIQRFFAMRLTAGDRARILMGRPPRGISMRAALGFGRVA